MTTVEGLSTTAEILDALRKAGSHVTEHQLERWRGQGLLPRPRIIGRGRGRGSIAFCPPGTLAQAMEISRLYKIREKRAWVGWQLWLRDFPVDDRYWRAAMEEARLAILGAKTLATEFDRSSEDQTAGEYREITLAALKGTPLYSALANLNPPMVETVIGFAVEILLGHFAGFSRDHDNNPNREERSAIAAIIGANPAQRDTIIGQRLNFEEQIEAGLKSISTALKGVSASNAVIEPDLAIRQEFTAIVDIAGSLYRSLVWAFGKSAFGLGVIERITANPSMIIQASMLIIWERLRASSDSLLSSIEVATLSESAVQLELQTIELKHHISTAELSNPISNATALKAAMADAGKLETWLNSIRDYKELTSK